MADSEKSNINSNQFDSENFVNNLILKKGLDELVTVEEDMIQSVRRLDYEMQVTFWELRQHFYYLFFSI